MAPTHELDVCHDIDFLLIMVLPSRRCRLPRHAWITEVNGRPTPDLTTFLAAANEAFSSSSTTLRLRVIKDGKLGVLTIRPDYVHYPTGIYTYNRKERQWDVDWKMDAIPKS